MRTLLKIILLFLLAFGLTWAYLKWRSHDRPGSEPITAAEIGEARSAVDSLRRRAKTGEIRLGGSDLERILVASLANSAIGRSVLESSVESRASVREDGIEVGVVLATAGLGQRLAGSGDQKLERMATLLGLMPGDGVYVGARGVPIVRDGQLSLDAASVELRLGPLTVSPEELADRLGLTSERLAGELLLGVDGVILDSVRVEGETLVLRARTLE